MRINKKHKHFSFEERCASQSEKGKLTPDKVRDAVAKADDYSAKLRALTEQTNWWLKMNPPPTQGFVADHERRCQQLQSKLRTLTAIPEVRAILLAREKKEEQA